MAVGSLEYPVNYVVSRPWLSISSSTGFYCLVNEGFEEPWLNQVSFLSFPIIFIVSSDFIGCLSWDLIVWVALKFAVEVIFVSTWVDVLVLSCELSMCYKGSPCNCKSAVASCLETLPFSIIVFWVLFPIFYESTWES